MLLKANFIGSSWNFLRAIKSDGLVILRHDILGAGASMR